MTDLKPVKDVSLRPASVDDIDQLVEIEAEANPSPWSRASIAAELEKPFSEFWVVTDDETDANIFGFVVFSAAAEQTQIFEIAVRKEYRRKGLGAAILQSVIKFSRKAKRDSIFLEVRKSNEPAIHFYQKFGFVVVRKREAFYSDGEAAYEMRFTWEDLPENSEDSDEG